MKSNSYFAPSALALALLSGCAGLPESNGGLDAARREYRAAQSTPETRNLAAAELKQAEDALSKANDAWERREERTDVDHLAYLARQRVAIAQAVGTRKAAEEAVSNANSERDAIRLAARTAEADSASRAAAAARLESDTSRNQSAESQRESDMARRDAESARRQADAAGKQATEAQSRSAALEAQLKDMNAKKTERGLVVTIGDVLFDTDQSVLKAGGMRNVDKLVGFLSQYPERRALIEGFTDNTGSTDHNQALSTRRADAVRAELVRNGVGRDRITTHGYGESHPVAGNDSADGRQLNRRVEIVLSEDGGKIMPRR